MNYNFIISGFSDEIDKNIDIQFQTLNELGISHFEVRGVEGKNISDLDDNELKTLKEKMQKYNIKVSSIGSPIGKIKIHDEFEPHFEKFKRVVEIAKYLGSKYIRMFSFYCPENEDPTKYKDEVINRLKAMVEYAEKNDVILLHENEKEIYGDIASRCKELFDEIKSPYFKAVFDPANFVQCNEITYPDAFDMLKDNIVYMHIKDATENGDVVPAGLGAGKVGEIINQLKKDSYNGFLSLEPHLGKFAGLDKLETDDKMTKLTDSSAEKFELAYNSLNKLIEG